ncbi:MAG: hypothetical protein LBH16_10845 [Treponema sp.]|jgi:hypothetical protein|nr:hypothetical protein [Treponema sp.]
MKKRFLFGFAAILLAMAVLGGCELFNNEGTIVVRNASTYSEDEFIGVRIRTNISDSVTTYRVVSTRSSLARGSSANFTLEAGKYDIQVLDVYNSWSRYTTAGWITLNAGDTKRYKFTGGAIVTD